MAEMGKKCVIVFSGGQDSTTCLWWAKKRGWDVHCLTFDYGQLHSIELDSARNIAKLAKVPLTVLAVPQVLRSTSPLVTQEAPKEYESFQQMEKETGKNVEATFVPMRNLFFLTIAMNFALSIGAKIVVTGVSQADNANYPDCTEAFIKKTEAAFRESLNDPEVRIVTPLLHLPKWKGVELAYTMPECWASLAYSHTSYDGKYPPTGKNHANVLRAEGFERAMLPDPLVLRAHAEGKMELPATYNYRQADIHLDAIRRTLRGMM